MGILARGTAHWVAIPLASGVLAGALGLPVAGLLLVGIAAFLAWFFRDPERALAEEGLVSPADGVVTMVRAKEPEEGGGHEVQIFMNLHNCHVNRAPCDGTVAGMRHFPGAHLPAWHKDSARNERVVWDLATPHGPLRVIQVAGLLARRIVPYAREGQGLGRGERIGIIRLGSRVDVHLPPGVAPAVRVGDRVLAGSRALARPAPAVEGAAPARVEASAAGEAASQESSTTL